MSSIDDRFPTQAVPMTTVPDTEAETETWVAVGAERTTKGGGLAWELLQTIVLTLAIFLGVRSVVQNFRVEVVVRNFHCIRAHSNCLRFLSMFAESYSTLGFFTGSSQ